MTKKISLIAMVTVTALALTALPVAAGSRQSHRWEGVAIGIGAAILGSALIANMQEQPVYVDSHRHHRHKHRHHYRSYDGDDDAYEPPPYHVYSGHWEIRKVWVSPVMGKIWMEGHHGAHHRWVPGHWTYTEIKPGYWRREKLWVANR